MSSNIKKIKLKEILEITSSKRIFMSEYLDSGIPFYRSKEIIEKSKGNNISTELFISEDRFNEIKMKFGVPVAGDILLTSVGTLGIPYLVQEQDEFYFKDGNLTWFRYFSNDINNKFMLCWLQSKNAKEQFDMITIGSTQKALTISSLKELEIPLPTLSIQKKIAHILSTLDDKIELNRKMNQTLEEMAQALFKSWFVDFDPVHTKAKCSSDEELEAAAKELGISKDVLDLFPSEFEESELGMIPKGWGHDKLGNFVEILDSKRVPLSKNEREKRKGKIPYHGATSIMDHVDDYIFDEPLTLMGEDGSVTREDGTPFMQYIWGRSWVNNHAHVLKSKSTLSTEAVYIALLKANVSRFVTGAVQPKINQGNLKEIPLVNPNNELHKVFSQLIDPMFCKIRIIYEEIQTLQKTRDTLLPKLLSGELDVSELELDLD